MARADSEGHLRARLDEAVDWSLGPLSDLDRSRISYARVDLTQRDLGLDSLGSSLLEGVEDLYSLASNISFSMSAEQAREANVETVNNLVHSCRKLREDGSLRVLHYVSTAYVATTRKPVAEPVPADLGERFRNTYERSKAHAEQLIRESEIPFLIYRPSIIVGSSRTGRAFGFDTVYNFVRSYARGTLPFVPATPGHRLDIVPSDYVARAMTALADAPPGETFHVTAGAGAPSVREVYESVRAAVGAHQGQHSGLDLRFFPPELIARAESAPPGLASSRLKRTARLISTYLPFLDTGVPEFDNTATIRATGLHPPKLKDYGTRVWSYALEHDFGSRNGDARKPARAKAGGGRATTTPRPDPRSLDGVILHAARHRPDGPAIVNADTVLTYTELAREVHERARLLEEQGIASGTRVALAMAHDSASVVTFLAALRAGANVLLLPEDAAPPPVWGPTLTLRAHEPPRGHLDPSVLSPHAGGCAFATSGTTGRPKLVQHPAGSLPASGRSTADAVGLDGSERVALFLPLYHAFASGIVLPSALYAGCAVVLPPAHWTGLETLSRTRVTHAVGVPTHFHSLVEEWRERERTGDTGLRLSRWTVSICGDDPVLPALRDDFERTFLRPLAQGYGLSEVLLSCFTAAADAEAPDCVGMPLPGTEISVRDPLGRTLPSGSQGRVWVSTPTSMVGYVGSEPRESRWTDTGDIGWVDAHGRLHVSGRLLRQDGICEVTEVNGRSFTSRQVENILLCSGKFRRVKVVFAGRTAHAFVVVEPGAGDHDPRELAGAFAGPIRITPVSRLPETPVGKVDRTALHGMIP